jgi:hypothetical protein
VVYYIERLIAVSAGKVAGLDGVESGIGRDLVRFATVGAYEHSDILPHSKGGGGNLPLLHDPIIVDEIRDYTHNRVNECNRDFSPTTL